MRRFADRTGIIALTDAVSAFLDGTELGAAVRARVTEELSVTDDLDWSPEDRAAFGKLAEELALLTAGPGHEEDETPDDVEDLLAEDDPPSTPLRAFAADPSAPQALAARALAWHEHIHYGLAGAGHRYRVCWRRRFRYVGNCSSPVGSICCT